jgi:hypothetical protein
MKILKRAEPTESLNDYRSEFKEGYLSSRKSSPRKKESSHDTISEDSFNQSPMQLFLTMNHEHDKCSGDDIGDCYISSCESLSDEEDDSIINNADQETPKF